MYSADKIIINAIIYIIVTAFFVYLLINEKKLGEKIRVYRNIFSEKIINIFNVEKDGAKKVIKKIVDITEMFGSAIILVLLLQHFYIGNFLVPTGSMIPTIEPKDRLLGDMVSYKFIKPSRGDIVVFKEPIENKVLYTKRLIGYPGEKVKIDENGDIFINNKVVKNKKINVKYFRKGFMSDKEWVIPKKGDTIEVIGGHSILKDESVQNIDIASFQQLMEINDAEVTEALPYARFLLNGKDETGPIIDFKYNKEIAEKLFKGEKIVLKEDYYFVLGDNSNNSYDSRFWGFVAENRIKGRPFMRFWPLNRIGILK